MYLGISGKLGVGKNYITENYIVPKIIHKFSNSKRQLVPYFFSFGSGVKVEMFSRDLSNILNYHNLFVEKTNQTRTMIQEYATENGRNVYREDMWIRAINLWTIIQSLNLEVINKHLDRKLVPLFVIEDIRFTNEYEYVKRLDGILVYIEAPVRNIERISHESTSTSITHISENGLGHLEFDLRLNNDPQYIDNIELQIDKYIRALNPID
jgi:hypothetical protein